MLHFFLNPTNFVLARIYSGYGGHQVSGLTDSQRQGFAYVLLFLFLCLIAWGTITLIRYFFREQMVRKKMRWSATADSFWDYDTIIDAAKNNYTKAQIMLTTHPETLKRLGAHERARLRLLTKKITSPQEIVYKNAYIVCFDDKKNDRKDSVAVYLEFTVRKKQRFKEILIMHREDEQWKITDYVKDPSMYMISHARSIIEKS